MNDRIYVRDRRLAQFIHIQRSIQIWKQNLNFFLRVSYGNVWIRHFLKKHGASERQTTILTTGNNVCAARLPLCLCR